jgi:hypothetical protein
MPRQQVQSNVRISWVVVLAAALTGGTARSAAAQEATDAQPEISSIARIREALAHEPALVIRQPTFHVTTSERRPTSFDLTDDTKPLHEPPTWNAGWHNEFLTMVTPPEFRMWQAFTNTNLLQISATSLAAAVAEKALAPIRDWRRDAREAQARDEVDRALADFLARHAGATPLVVAPR